LDRARLLHALVSTALVTDNNLDLLALTTEAVQLLPADAPAALKAQILAVHARANADRARHDDAVRWAREAFSLADDLGLVAVAADAATTLANLDNRAGDPREVEEALVKAVAKARSGREVTAELRGLFNLGVLYYEQGRLARAQEVYNETWQRAKATGRPWAPYGFDARAHSALVAQIRSDWPAASSIVNFRGESPPALSEAVLAAVSLQVAAGLGDTRALEALPRLRPWWERDGFIAIICCGACIDLLGDSGDRIGAEALHDEAVAAIAALWKNPNFQARIRLSGLLLGQLASGASRLGLAERADLSQRCDRLVAATAQVAESGVEDGRRRGPEGVAWIARVSAEHARLRWLTGVDPFPEDELVGRWQEAVLAFQQLGHVYETARSRARLAAVLQASGHAVEAAREISQAHEVASHLGSRPLLTELQTLGLPVRPSPASSTARRDMPLTPRESEVLALVAQGRSNREIALHLFISAKTASVHVSNILAKLDASGRTEAVAVARRRGLLADGNSG
jgi:DNA-binding CsgD family transcriptional regulator